jgi:hypothetical protein
MISIFVESTDLKSIVAEHEIEDLTFMKHNNVFLLDIPTDLKLQIIQSLDGVDQICPKMTCRILNELIPRLDMQQLLRVEQSSFGMREKLGGIRIATWLEYIYDQV